MIGCRILRVVLTHGADPGETGDMTHKMLHLGPLKKRYLSVTALRMTALIVQWSSAWRDALRCEVALQNTLQEVLLTKTSSHTCFTHAVYFTTCSQETEKRHCTLRRMPSQRKTSRVVS